MPGQLHVRLRMKLPNDARSVALARRLVRCALGSLDVTEDCTDDLVLAVSEACTNVLDHAGLDDEYEVVAGIDGSRCVLEIADDGPGIAVRPRAARWFRRPRRRERPGAAASSKPWSTRSSSRLAATAASSSACARSWCTERPDGRLRCRGVPVSSDAPDASAPEVAWSHLMTARVGVVSFPGSLDDRDALRAITAAGATAVTLWHKDAGLARR